MPSFTFSGFPLGSSVQLAADQGGATATGSVSTWGQNTLASIGINTISTTAPVAPAGIWFEAVNLSGFNVNGGPAPGEIYDPSAHEITYVWTIRNAPLAPYQAPENMVTGWNNPNLAYGKKVAFAFPDPGTYVVDLWAIDSEGAIGTAEATVVVGNADSLYPGTLTICFSNDPGETWAGEKPGCQRVTTTAGLQSAIEAAAPNVPRILLKRGQTVTNLGLRVDQGQLGYLGAWGSGSERPIVNQTGGYAIQFRDGATMPEFTCSSIDFRGLWDSTTETGRPGETPIYFQLKTTDCHFTIHGCAFDGFTAVTLSPGQSTETIVVFADNVITNWRDYGIYTHTSDNPNARMAIIGCRIAQHVDALNGGEKNGLFNTHGPIRYASTAIVYVAVCDLFSRCGWSGLGSDTADQPCLRCNSVGYSDRYLGVDRLVAEGGFRVLQIGGQNPGASGTVEYPGNYVLDKVLCISTAKTIGPFVFAQFGGTTIRNTLAVMPNTPQYHTGNTWQWSVFMGPDNPGAVNADAPMAVHSSSFIGLRDSGNDLNAIWALDDNTSAFNTMIRENYVLHAPALDTPVAPAAPIDLSAAIPGVQPRYRGVRFNFEGQNGSFGGDIAPGGSFTIPYAQITTDLVRQTGGAATDQAYWTAIEAIDTEHLLMTRNQYNNAVAFTAVDGEFTVAFEPSAVRITNTSTEIWYTDYSLRLDRKSLIPPMQSAFASPSSLPLPRPGPGSAAENSGDLGFRAYDDFMGDVRPGPSQTGQDHRNQPRPASGNEQGALLTG